MSLHQLGVEASLDAIARRECSADELFAACLKRSEARNPSLAAFRFLEDAASPQIEGALAGIPFAMKSNIAIRDRELSCGSRLLEGYQSLYDSTVQQRLRDSGARLLGQTNMDEFAMGSSSEHCAFGVTRNPWDLERTPGGSSSGSAAAVADFQVPFALGSDTGGSIRQPAGFCGVVGFKPSYGRVSRWGLVAFASSLDQIGPITRSVRDAALVYAAIAGPDEFDATASTAAVGDPLADIEAGCEGLCLGVPRGLLEQGIDPDVRANFDQLLTRLEAAGAKLVDVCLDRTRYGVAAYYIIATAEASSNLARFDGIRYGQRVEAERLEDMLRATRSAGFGDEVKLRILLGSYVLSSGYYDAYYRKAQQTRTLLLDEYRTALGSCDALIMPTSPSTAFRFGDRLDDPLQMYASDSLTVAANLTGMPAIAVPSGVDGDGLPCSVQLMGRRFEDATVLRAARAVEQLCDFEATHEAHIFGDADGRV